MPAQVEQYVDPREKVKSQTNVNLRQKIRNAVPKSELGLTEGEAKARQIGCMDCEARWSRACVVDY